MNNQKHMAMYMEDAVLLGVWERKRSSLTGCSSVLLEFYVLCRNLRIRCSSSAFTSSGMVAEGNRQTEIEFASRRYAGAHNCDRMRAQLTSSARSDLRDELVDRDVLESLAADDLCK